MKVSGNIVYKFSLKDGVLKYELRAPFLLLFGLMGSTTNVGMQINTILKFEHKKTATYQKLILYKYEHNLRKENRLVVKTISLILLPWDKGIPDLIEALIDIQKSTAEGQNVGLLPVKEQAKTIAKEELSKQHLLEGSDKRARELILITDYNTSSLSPDQIDFHNPAAMESLVN